MNKELDQKKNSVTGCMLSALLFMAIFYGSIILADFLGNLLSPWVLLFGGFAVLFIVFAGIAYYAEHFKLQPADSSYLKLPYEEKKDLPRFKFYKRFFGVLFWLGLCCCIFSCTSQWNQNEMITPARQEVKEWNAENIPVPYLQDRNQYVSNPDTVLRQATVDSMNVILRNLETECQIQSIVVVVNHVENADVFRVAQDLGNNYGVGDKETNRGLVMVVAYKDRKYFIAPGRGLEADLTDAECSQLARTYLTPYMKVNNPNEGMYQLVNATYQLVKGKPLPAAPDEYRLSNNTESSEGMDFETWIFLILFFWITGYGVLNEKYRWLVLSSLGGTGFTGFGRDRAGSGGSWGSGWRGGGGFGGGFGGGGSFGGGSFGGGGAGGGW